MLHRHGALACFDYAAAGPYLPIDMAGKDAVFLSPHKFPGGPGTPGILVAKRALLRSPVPSVPGGGTIVFVSPTGQATTRTRRSARRRGRRRSSSRSAPGSCSRSRRRSAPRRSGGARASSPAARSRRGATNPNLRILGNRELERLAIVSFGVRHPRGLLHSNFVVAVLSDLFGIQARSGCFCAGPYIHRLYPIDDAWSASMHAQTRLGRLGAKLAFARVSFDYFMSEAVFDYIVEAVHLIANDGWKLLPLYRFDPATGLWHHAEGRARPLLSLDGSSSSGSARRSRRAPGERARAPARRGAADHPRGAAQPRRPTRRCQPEFERIRWFPLEQHAEGDDEAELDQRHERDAAARMLKVPASTMPGTGDDRAGGRQRRAACRRRSRAAAASSRARATRKML